MYVAKISYQQASSAAKQTTGERPERPEQPERPERPEATSQGPPSAKELREQIKQSILAAQDAAREAENDARNAQRQARDAASRAPGTTIQPRDFVDNVIPPQAVDIAIGFFVMCAVMVIGWPLARAFGRRLERNAPNAQAAIPAGMGDQLQRIEQAVEAMSIEIERISESQRFLTKLQSASQAEQAALPASDRR